MSDATRPQDRIAFWRRTWFKYAAATLVVILGLVWLLAPRRVWEVASVDKALRWRKVDAPPRYSVVWRPAEEVKALPVEAAAGDSTIRPQLADAGMTLYFTLRQDGHTDVYRARRAGEAWAPAEPVAAWNSPHDEVGPVLTDDGRRAYFYSNRPGGFGGFDLYVSDWDGKNWGKPQNLGPRVNSPAHEYDPAVTRDGRRLIFASNRTPQMQRHAEKGGEFERGVPWNTTLRAHLDALPFDLYAVERAEDAETWSAPRPLTGVNLPQSSEGAPYVAPGDAFLYFASDRLQREGETPNFDLYRARLRDSDAVEVENLGRGVNTPLNELEPALSPEGFTLYFSRNRDDEKAEALAHETYMLYASTAVEVVDERAWDASRWSALTGWFASNWWWLVMALLLLTLLAAIAWCLREITLRRATVPVFFTLALLVHLFLVTGSFFVGLDDDLIALLPQEMREVIVAEESYDDPNEAGEVPPQPFEQTADLEELPAAAPGDVARQTPASTPSPINTAVRINTTTPLPPGRLVYEAPEPQEPLSATAAPPAQELALVRRKIDLPEQAEMVDSELLPPAPESTSPPTPMSEAVNLDRKPPSLDAPAPLSAPSMLPTKTLARETVEMEPPIQTPAAPPVAALRFARRRPMDARPPADTLVATEPIAAPAARTQATPPTTDVEIVRAATRPAMSTPPQHLDVTATPSPTPSLDTEVIADAAMADAVPSTTSAPINTPRRAALDVAAAETAPEAQAEPAPAAEATVEADAADSLRAEVALARQATAAPVATSQPAPKTTLAADLLDLAYEGDLARVQSDAAAAPESSRAEVLLTRLSSNPLAQAETMEGVEMAQAHQTPAPSDAEPTTEGPQVAVARQAASTLEAAAAALSPTLRPTESLPVPIMHELESVESAAPQPLALSVVADLRRTAQPDRAIFGDDAERIEIAPAVALADATQDDTSAQLAAAQVALARQNAAAPDTGALLPISLKRMNGLSRAFPDSNELPEVRIEAAPVLSRGMADLARRDSRAPVLMYAEDNIGLQAMLRLRQSEAKEDLLQAFGGNDQTEAAVRRGLAWLAQHQYRDGHWSLDHFGDMCGEHHSNQKCGGHGRQADTAATGFALLPFLGAGHTHQDGDYADTVGRGLAWLVAHQKKDGDLFTGGPGNGHMYSHGVAAIAVCEAYAMTKDPRLRTSAQTAIDFIVRSQHKGSGGWRYSPGQDGDTSVFGWQVMALKSGQIAGLNVPQETLNQAKKWLDRVGAKGKQVGQFGYINAHPSPAMSAEALLCVQYLGAERNDPRLLQGGDYLLNHLHPTDTSYYWYYATQVMYHLQGEHWRRWNEAQRDELVNSQRKDGPAAGTWDPKDRWEKDGGRIYATSLRLLMLEVYYRHLPLYQALEWQKNGRFCSWAPKLSKARPTQFLARATSFRVQIRSEDRKNSWENARILNAREFHSAHRRRSKLPDSWPGAPRTRCIRVRGCNSVQLILGTEARYHPTSPLTETAL